MTPSTMQETPQARSPTLEQAVQLHAQGKLDQAELACRAALEERPNCAEALHLLGLVRFAQQRPSEAVECMRAALEQAPASASVLSDLGRFLLELGRPDEALASFDKALALRPDHADALNNRGVALVDLKRLKEALESFDQALALRPDYVEALSNRGNTLRRLDRLEEALASFDRALALRPDFADALSNRGNTLSLLNRPQEALESFDRALAIKPNFVEALNNRGNTLARLNRLDEALASLDKALAVKPTFVAALNSRGVALVEMKRPDDALESFDRALALRPDYAEALSNQGVVLMELGRLGEAIAAIDAAIAIEPDFADALFNRALIALRMGDFPTGWKGYERRWQRHGATPRKLTAPYPEWRGEDIRGKRIIVYEEQGLGDSLQFARYLTRLSSLGAEVTFLVGSNLHRLLQPFASTIRLVDRLPEGERFDFQSALLSLPGAFGTTVETIPCEIPYLFPEASRVAHWRQRIGAHGLKVGISWQGNPVGAIDNGRSVPLRVFDALAKVPGLRLISIQKHYGLKQLANLPSGMTVETLGDEFDMGPDAFLDTAAAMACLDLIVTCDTSVAHLAGALGRPVWVALKQAPDWRWLLDRSDSPWYPTMRLYRQTVRGDWVGVFANIAADVARLGAPAVPTNATPPVGAGFAADRSSSRPEGIDLPPHLQLRRCRHGLMLYNLNDVPVGAMLEKYGEVLEDEIDLFRQIPRPGMTVVEAGAGIGALTIPIATLVGPRGRVLAFEPRRSVFQILCANLALNGIENVEARWSAASDASGHVTVPRLDSDATQSAWEIGAAQVGDLVQRITLDSLELPACHFLKIDVAGVEAEVLRGARGCLGRHWPFLYVGDRLKKSGELLGLLKELGYRCYWHRPRYVRLPNYRGDAENRYPNLVATNLFCVPRHQNIIVKRMEEAVIA